MRSWGHLRRKPLKRQDDTNPLRFGVVRAKSEKPPRRLQTCKFINNSSRLHGPSFCGRIITIVGSRDGKVVLWTERNFEIGCPVGAGFLAGFRRAHMKTRTKRKLSIQQIVQFGRNRADFSPPTLLRRAQESRRARQMVSERIGSDPIGVIKEDLLKKLRGVRRQLGEGIQLPRLVSRCARTDRLRHFGVSW